MQPLYTKAEFKTAKSRQLLPLRCLHCKRTFYKPKNRILADLGPNRKNKRPQSGCYCSYKCITLHLHPPTAIVCDQCRRSFLRWPSQIKKSKHHFCCHSCAAKWTNAHKIRGIRASKLEKWLAIQLPNLHSTLEFHFNRKDAINGELDIYIPSLKLAFELNGIFHYEPIYGERKLSAMQTNDARKVQACLERGIELCIIDVSSMSYFKEQRAMKFLNIIQNIIDSKLSGSSPVKQTVSSRRHAETP